MHALSHDHIGARIRRLRVERHLTQRALSDLSQIPYGTLKKVEQGVTATTPYVIAAIARALHVPVASLTGHPYAIDLTGVIDLRHDEPQMPAQPIRDALDVFDLGADPDIRARPLSLLREDAVAMLAAVRAGEILKVAEQLPSMLLETTTAAHQASSSEGWRLLASTYRTAYDVATKLGFADLAALALARMDWAARRGSDAVMSAMCGYMRALTHLRTGEHRTGARLVQSGFDTLAQAETSRERDVLLGQLHLGAAVMAGGLHQRVTAEEHVETAERIAEQTGEATKVHWLTFGPTNVAVHRVSVLAELDEYAAAAQAGRDVVIPGDWPASRRSHHYAELARAQMWAGAREEAFQNLLRAKRTAPQQARYHRAVRETYAGLATTKGQLPDGFISYGSWLDV